MSGREQTLTQTTAMLSGIAPFRRRLRRFLRSPKGYLLLALVPLLLIAAPSTGVHDAAVTVTAAVLGATLLELGCVRLRGGEWELPSSALLSGLIVAMVISAQQPWYVAASAGVLATASKHLLRVGRGHIFNPAAVGLLAVYYLFGSGESWWGALPDLPAVACLALLAAGFIVANRANKLPAMLAFLLVYAVRFTGAAVTGDAASVADVFRPPFINMAVFFACFMIADPPTSPVPFTQQAVFGAFATLVASTVYIATHGLYYLLYGLLAANLGYALWQHLRARQRRAAMTGVGKAAGTADLGRLAATGLAGWAGAIVLLLAAGLAIAHHTSNGAAAVAGGTSTSVTTASGTTAGRSTAGSAAASAPAAAPTNATQGLTFQDRFSGTVSRAQSVDGTALDYDLNGTGERPVRLVVHVVMSATRGRRNRPTVNQATLYDGKGATLCQGQVTQLDGQSLSVECMADGNTASGPIELDATMTATAATQIEGDLSAAPISNSNSD